MRQKVIFLHIPKTAGTSVVRLIQKNYTPVQCFGLYNQESFERDYIRAMANEDIQALYGHFFFQPIIKRDAQQSFLFTFLRHPHHWQVSNYLHIKYSDDEHHKAWRANWHGFEDYLKDKQANNRQTRMLSGIMPYKNFAADLPRALAQAKENLLHMDAVGFSEHFTESIMPIAQRLGWKYFSVARQNVGSHRIEAFYLLKRYHKALTAVSVYDRQLYDFAKDKYLKT